MTAVHWHGPLITVRGNPYGTQGVGTVENPHEGTPSAFLQGTALLDPRSMFTWIPGGSNTKPAYIWVDAGGFIAVNAVPATANAANIAASQSPGAGAIVLTAGAGVTGNVSITRADTQATVTGLLAIDYVTPTAIALGLDGTFNMFNPANNLARRLTYVSGGVDTGITFTTTGFDIYGMPMSETITGASGAAAAGIKAFKYIQSITHTGSVASTITVGTTDFFGFPLRSDIFADVDINWANGWITASTGYSNAVLTNPSTTTTADVRGIYNTQSASNGANRLVIYQNPINSPSNIPNFTTVNGMFGIPQNLATFSGA